MPASSNSSAAYQWRESWPPSQIHLRPTAAADHHNDNAPAMIKDEGSHDQMHLADDNPLIYFLTPTPPLLSVDEDGESYFVDDSDSSSYNYDNDLDDDDSAFYSSGMDFEFDAGIEDATHPQPTVRSVSPSSLANSLCTGNSSGRVSSTTMRPPTPPRARESLHPDGIVNGGDKDGENYIHFGSADYAGQPIPSAKGKAASRSSSHSYLSSSPLSSSPASPRLTADLHDLYANHHSNNSTSHLTAAGAMIVRRRSPRSWRVPSPEVFSIEEETEEELSTCVAADDRPGRSRTQSHQHHHHHHYPERNLQVEAANPQKKKQVRFVLPGEEIA